MKTSFILLLSAAAAISGCATFNDRELASIQARGISPPVLTKLERGRPVELADVIELTRRGVPQGLILRQIDDHGVSSLITRADVVALRRAGASAVVIDAMLRASDVFADDYGPTRGSVGYSDFDDSFDEFAPYGYGPYDRASFSVGLSSSRNHYGHHRGRH